ncbi:MAG: tetratricopeptide repeat protein [Spirochaetales bacterium]|nr:tetratricopeptide repeat protein [Spirochaetales bacterium]
METTEPALNRLELEEAWRSSLADREAVVQAMAARMRKVLEDSGLRPGVKARVKSFPSYFKKRIRLYQQARASGRSPIPLTDLLGVRFVCPFIGDLAKVEEELGRAFRVVEVERKGAERSFREFGYESIHLLVEIPKDLREDAPSLEAEVVEVQIRTILQEAWAEVEHELVYKAEFTPFDEPMRRKLAALNANLTLSDIIFQEIRDYQHQLSDELARRRGAFYRKIEQAIDLPFFSDIAPPAPVAPKADLDYLREYASSDDMLLAALAAHNRGDYLRAIDLYSRILAHDTRQEARAVILKHRAMAYFSESRYDESLEDFSKALELDPRCYKSAYYRGVIHSIRARYAEAIVDFDRALDIHPYHFYSLMRRAQAFFHLADYPRALADCDAAQSINPDDDHSRRLGDLLRSRLADHS